MKLTKPFIRLPFAFDAGRLAEEVTSLEPSVWMPHPSGMRGNTAVALISQEGKDNHGFGGTMKATPHLEKCPYHQQVMAGFDEVLARSRLMKLEAGCEVVTHVDFNYHWYSRVRIHIPVTTNPDVIFYCGDRRLHMKAGECWIFDNWRRHRVVNDGTDERIHLVIDLAGSSRFWHMVRQTEQAGIHENIGASDQTIRHVPYIPGKEVKIRTEKYNISPVMPPGEIDALVSDLIRDFEACLHNDPRLVEKYRILLEDFARDWREVWHLYGMQSAGIPGYRRLIDGLYHRLHPDRRALVTASNEIGVNPIIVQRILRSALAPEQYEPFFKDIAQQID